MPAKKGKKMPTKKKKSKSLASTPRFSKRSLTLFGVVFALIGAFLLYSIFAASTTVHYFGALSESNKTADYTITTGAGNMAVSFSNNTADVKLTVRNKAGTTVGTLYSKGKRDVKASYTVAADTYTFSLTSAAKFTAKKGYSIYITFPTKEVTSPTAIISSPLATASASGIVNFEAYSKSELPIDRMEFFVDGSLLKADITSPYSVQWDTTKYTNGAHTISVTSFDNAGRTGVSSGVITVGNTTTPPPTVPTTGNFDTVLLRPPAGKLLLGANAPESGFANIKELRGGKAPHIFHDYARSGANVKSIIANAKAEGILFINFKPGGAMGPAEYKKILAGDRDGEIKIAAAAVKAYGKKMFFAPLHEPENDDKTSPFVGDADYAKAWTYIINMMESNGATNIVATWNVMGFKEWIPRYDKLYPGDGVVDWIASDPYSHANETLNDFGGGSTKQFYAWASKKNKPMMWAEWGLDGVKVPGNAARFFSQSGLDSLQKEMPLIQALVYWSQWEYVVSHFPNEFKAFTQLEEFNFVPPASVMKPAPPKP